MLVDIVAGLGFVKEAGQEIFVAHKIGPVKPREFSKLSHTGFWAEPSDRNEASVRRYHRSLGLTPYAIQGGFQLQKCACGL